MQTLSTNIGTEPMRSSAGFASRDTATLDATPQVASADLSIVDRLKGWLSHTTDLKARFADLQKAVERVTEQLVRLIVVFVLQTVVVPVLLLWLMLSVLRKLLAADRP